MVGELRPGEMVLAGIAEPDGPRLHFIGSIRSPWGPEDCPKNIGRAREAGMGARVELDPAFAPALAGLTVGQPVILLYWMDRARRDLLVQAPRHVEAPRGTFALRSPNRPNTISQATVRITTLDPVQGVIGIDAIDCFDGTPLVDIKPWLETVDMPPDSAAD
ncbi:TrmO family methyltransferase domain-containing protein [Rhodovulum euryhalinum]|uniref:tRNA-Thr(GGU) m(6)t(6)A37 methyltransferase TsaA n=1 Tax=Rhodovulum euryhalinum TaxID=35805 RepID=A0A4R2KCW2_9RHOB|nr:TrmO family methyltransferase [Rhodovulum euryhalinum]TCO69947.1 tRNA-Thr(GGU) m(6)t(6)A37 methyltransferase TsaA [Rhodovulum euryhalinum]